MVDFSFSFRSFLEEVIGLAGLYLLGQVDNFIDKLHIIVSGVT